MEFLTETAFWQLVKEASPVVQATMFVLAAASFLSWIVIIQRYLIISGSRSALDVFERKFWSGMDLNTLFYEIRDNKNNIRGINNVFVDGYEEFNRLLKKRASADATMEGVQRLMRVAINREEESLISGLGFLASRGFGEPLHRSFWYGLGDYECVPGACRIHRGDHH